MSEQVYCLPQDTLPPPNARVLPLDDARYRQLLDAGRFLPRAAVEEDERWRQLIPYAVISHDERVLLVRRLKAGGEARLHERYSIGIGGHINPQDINLQDTNLQDVASARNLLEAAMTRELREELVIGAFFAEAVGLIHKADTPVDRVHTGVLYRVRVAEAATVRETTKLEGHFLPVGEIVGYYERLEGWSQTAAAFLWPELFC